MADPTTQNISMALYRYMCQNIVGSEDYVKRIRLMNAVRDNLLSDNGEAVITSGSFGEGLDMKGSDLDVMYVSKEVEVYENVKPRLNESKTYYAMKTDDVKPGCTQLLLKYTCCHSVFYLCKEINGEHYCSSALFKEKLLGGFLNKIHGPCVGDNYNMIDYANCLHCKSWISTARQWLTRSNNSWPSYDVKQEIKKHGVLFVPIGDQELFASKKDLEWRISFSVGEKLLMNTFTHTQLLCYALLKILMKDVIASFSECQDLLCSYFLKTMIFWMSEELTQSVWKPCNLISCFMRCFDRLVYCVEYSVCQHYFIPENNMFENKIEGPARKTLLENLNLLRRYGWRCILFSNQVYNLHVSMLNFHNEPHTVHMHENEDKNIFGSYLLKIANMLASQQIPVLYNGKFLLKRGIQQIASNEKSSIKYLVSYYMSMWCTQLAQFTQLKWTNSNNKYQYRQYKSCLSLLLQNIYHDAVSGWLMLASCFYQTKQYDKALHVILYAISKCSPEKLYRRSRAMCDIHHQLLNRKSFKKKNIAYLCKIVLVDFVVFNRNSKLIPNELQSKGYNKIFVCVSPAYAYFLKFLCHYHLNLVRQCQDSLEDLRRVIAEHLFILDHMEISISYNLLGIALQLSGDNELARQAFLQSDNIFPYHEFPSSR